MTMMGGLINGGICLATLLAAVAQAASNTTAQSRHILPSSFTPPSVFENTNLVRMINLEKSYPRQQINVVIKNTGTQPEDQYYVPFEGTVIASIGGFEARDKQKGDLPPFAVELVDYDTYSPTQFYRITLPTPLGPEEQQTLAISYHINSALTPLPAKTGQNDKQHLLYPFSAYFPSTYPTLKQKTKVRFPSAEVLAYTTLPKDSEDGVKSENAEDPVRSGTTYTYGPFGLVPSGVLSPASVHYENTNPLNHVSLLERDVEISHWGGNLATEERFWLENKGAALTSQFNRVLWQQSSYYSPPSVALQSLIIPLLPGSKDAYFIDDIGNVSTSHFNLGDGVSKPATLDIKPRYPVFGSWKYKFRIGWDRDLKTSLRRLKQGDTYVLRVPFLEGPKNREGIEYAKVVSRIILPEGARNVQFSTTIPLVSSDVSSHRTFMDTEGRTTVTLTAVNLSDESRTQHILVTYDYPFSASLRKPLTILTAVFSIFVVTWLVSKVDVRIVGKQV